MQARIKWIFTTLYGKVDTKLHGEYYYFENIKLFR